MPASQNENRALAEYLQRRLEHLEQCNAEIETKLTYDGIELCRKIDEGEYDKNGPAVGQMIRHIEYIVGNTFRYTMLVGVCSFLEEALKQITKLLIPKYDAAIKKQRRGNWLARHIDVLRGTAGLDTGRINADLDTFHHLIALRNCIVHAWGKVAEARDPDAVRAASERIETVAVSADGYLVLGDQVVPTAIIAAENIAERILTSKLNASMT